MPKRSARIWVATPQAILYAGNGADGAASGSIGWRVTNPPGMRCWVATGVVFLPSTAGVSTAPTGTARPSLWLSEMENPYDLEASDRAFPIENLVGTSAAPLAIPTDAGLLGKEVTVQTGARWLRGVLSWSANVPGAQTGTWYAFARWWEATEMCDAEWQQYNAGMLLALDSAGQPGSQAPT